MLPLECQYLNKNALTTLAGPLTPPVKHFQLKRKPKSATLRAELLQKCECRASVRRGWGRLGRWGWGCQGLCPPEAGTALHSQAWEVLQASGDWLAGTRCLLSHVSSFCSEVPSGFTVPNYLLKTVFYIAFSIRNSLILG